MMIWLWQCVFLMQVSLINRQAYHYIHRARWHMVNCLVEDVSSQISDRGRSQCHHITDIDYWLLTISWLRLRRLTAFLPLANIWYCCFYVYPIEIIEPRDTNYKTTQPKSCNICSELHDSWFGFRFKGCSTQNSAQHSFLQFQIHIHDWLRSCSWCLMIPRYW